MLRNRLKTFSLAGCLMFGAIGVSACRQDMHDNPRYEAYEEGANRQLPEGTVARGSLDTNPAAPRTTTPTGQASPAPGVNPTMVAANALSTGASSPAVVPAGEEGLPFKVTMEILDRGESRFNISCSPCHGKLGDGNGMIPNRGFRRPPSYHQDRLRLAPASHFYDVMTNGFGAMPSYADQLTPEDRWKVIAYVRALQLSQNAKLADLSENDKRELEKSEKKETSGGHHN